MCTAITCLFLLSIRIAFSIILKPEVMKATKRGVCMYDLPAKFNVDLQNSTYGKTQPMTRPIHDLSPPFSGMHVAMDVWLDMVVYVRMQQEATEVLPASQCKLFYVPYFSQWETFGTGPGQWRDADRPDMDNEVITYLKYMGRFRKPAGVDHFITLSRIQFDHTGPINLLSNPSYKHMQKLIIETRPGWSSTVPTLHSVPYPAWFRFNPSSLDQSSGEKSLSKIESVSIQMQAIGPDLPNLAAGALCLRGLKHTLTSVCKGKPFCSVHVPPPCSTAAFQGEYTCSRGNVFQARTSIASGCWSIASRDQCCLHTDGRSGTSFFGQECVPSTPGQTFTSNRVCEPACWTTATCSDSPQGGHRRQGSRIGTCQQAGTTLINSTAISTTSEPFSTIAKQSFGTALVMGCQRGPCWLWGDCYKPLGRQLSGPLAVFVGSARPVEKWRNAAVEQCKKRPGVCVFFYTGQRDYAHVRMTEAWMVRMNEMLLSSVFCINPPGDSPTRKGLFDSLLAGCIPVIFDETSLSTYTWFLPDWRAVSVYIPKDTLMSSSFNLVDYLGNMETKTIRAKQKAIKEVAFHLQYSEMPATKSHRFGDAFDMIMTGLGV